MPGLHWNLEARRARRASLLGRGLRSSGSALIGLACDLLRRLRFARPGFQKQNSLPDTHHHDQGQGVPLHVGQ